MTSKTPSFTDLAKCANCRLKILKNGRNFCEFYKDYFINIKIFEHTETRSLEVNSDCAHIQLITDYAEEVKT